jgi:beta-glucosidase
MSDTATHGPDLDLLLGAMTTAEKVALMAGASLWATTPIKRLGIPAIKVTDGPNGARGASGFVGGSMTSACFPCATSLAATWNVDLIERIGAAIAQEAKSKSAHLLLAPTVNIHRTPLNGRAFECFSEDPFLSARIAVAYISGVQREGIGVVVKHFVGNESEDDRHTISSEIDERALREIYLPPFEGAVREAGAWAVMSGYNRLNGVHMDAHAPLLQDLLKTEWEFEGVVISDWFGTTSTAASAVAGLDLEMPGPPRWRGERLLAAVDRGEVTLEAIDDAARRILHLIDRSGAFSHPDLEPERAEDRPEHRALIRAAAAEGIVLLKNSDALLPLALDRLSSIAVIGPAAKHPPIHGGGSAQVNAHHIAAPNEAILARAGAGADVSYEMGCTNHYYLPRLDCDGSSPGDGFRIAYHGNLDLSGEPLHVETSPYSEQIWLGNLPPALDPSNFSARLTTSFTPVQSGLHQFSLLSSGRSRFLIGEVEYIDNWTDQTPGDSYFGMGSTERIAEIELNAGEKYDLQVDYSSEGALMKAVRLGYLPPLPEDPIALAVALAAASDVALVFAGTGGDWETESRDRTSLELPGEQNRLIERVAAANPKSVVVLMTGAPVAMPWLDRVGAVVQAWFPGQECGDAVADLLFGDRSPSGRLPLSFPNRIEETPAFGSYPGVDGRVLYREGVFVGYRGYEQNEVKPLFPFGFGLSYTTFGYERLTLKRTGADSTYGWTVTVDVTNTGDRAGHEVVQLYVADPVARVPRPPKELKGFGKVWLEPGERQTVTFRLDQRSFAFWDDALHDWVAEPGEYQILIGASSVDIRLSARIDLAAKSEN